MTIKETDYLQHHGILGQKWGTRNGPPYPLGGGDYTKAEKQAIYKKRKSKNSIYNKKHFDEVLNSNKNSSDAASNKKSKSSNTSENSKDSKSKKTSSNKMPTAEKVAIGVGIGAAVTIGALAAVVQKTKYGYISRVVDIQGVQKKFYDALREAGYNAVVDINDLKNSRTVRGRSPIIVFDASTMVQSAVHELSDKEIREAYIPAMKKQKFRQFIEDNSDTIGMAAGLLGGSYASAIAGYDIYRNTNNKTKKNSTKGR